MSRDQAWLALYSWAFVTAQNAALCQAKNALHKPTSEEMAFRKFCTSLETPGDGTVGRRD
jgi:hypothetical protein